MAGVIGTPSETGSRGTPTTLLTFLVADVRGYTGFSAERGDQAAAHLSELFLSLCRTVVSGHGGEVFGSAGDQAVAAFPSAHAAIYAAIELQTQLREAQAAHSDLPLVAGIGLDTGEAVKLESDYRGNAINLAARLCSLAGGGEIFASDTVIHVARTVDGLAVVDRGEVTIKGLPAPVRVVQIAPEGALPLELPPLQPILVTYPTNLPDDATPFIGRAREINQIADLLRTPAIRLVTLTGPGGTGKTRLALQAGNSLLNSFSDGVYFVDLSSLADPSLVPSAIAEVLSVKKETGEDLMQTLAEDLREKRLLLVLDNFEHLLGACPVVVTLLDRCRELRILVTSRIPLHLGREHEYDVPPLSVPDSSFPITAEQLSQYEAVALFNERAQAVRASFVVTNENAPAVAEICVRLDGLPLAIELAAARIKLFQPQALLSRLANRLSLLTGGARDRPSRQQTLRNAIDWSYSLLTEEEQLLFARLSVFAGGCSLEAAEAVCNSDGAYDLLEGLTSLVDKSLVRQEGEEEPRFSMLETIREYATERLSALEDGQQTPEAHAAYFLAFAQQADAHLYKDDQGVWIDRLNRDIDNIRAALRRHLKAGRADEVLRLTLSLRVYWGDYGLWNEEERWLQAGLQRTAGVAPPLRAVALQQLGRLLTGAGELERAQQAEEEALAIFRDAGELGHAADMLYAMSWVASMQCRYERATTWAEEGLALSRHAGDQSSEGLTALGSLHAMQGNLDSALALFQQALGVERARGDVVSIAGALNNLGFAAIYHGDLARARSALDEALALAQNVGDRSLICRTLHHLGYLDIKDGNYLRAFERIRESLLLWRALHAKPYLLEALEAMTALAEATVEWRRAAYLGGAVTALTQQFGIFQSKPQQQQLEEVIAQARSRLAEDEWNEAWERGSTMSLDEAVAYALQKGEPDDGSGSGAMHTMQLFDADA